MSDELMIQGVNPQIQRVSTTPYLLGGAALGAAAGVGGAYAYDAMRNKKTMTRDELVAEANKKDSVELKSKQDAVAKAEKDLAEAGKAVYEGQEKIDYEKALKEKEDAFNKLIDEKKAALEGSNGGINTKKFRKVDTLRPDELPSETVAGKKLNADQAKALYTKMTDDVKNKEAAVERRLKAGIGGTRDNVKNAITAYNNSQFASYGTKTIEEIDEIFAKKTELSGLIGFRTEKPTAQYRHAFNEAIKEYPQFTSASLKPEHYLEFAQEVDKNTPIQKGYTRKGIHLVDPKTNRPSTKTTYVEYKTSDLTNFVEEQEKLVNEKRIAYADQLFTNAHESVLLQKQKLTFVDDFGANVEKGLANQTGLYNDASNKLNMSEIIDGDTRTLNPMTNKKGVRYKGYEADIRAFEKEIKDAKKAGRTPVMPGSLNGSYTGVTDVEKALEMANARKSVVNSYTKELKDLQSRIDKLVTSNTIIEELDAKIAAEKASDKALNNAKAKLAEQFPALFGENTSGLTADQIEAQAREYAEKNINKSYQEKVDKLKDAYEKVKNEKGKVNEGAKKAAEENLAKVKGELDSFLNKFGKAAEKLSTAKKGWIAAGTAAVGALIGTGMASSKNKKIEEAAQNLYA